MNKRGLTAWEAIRLLLPEAETEAQADMIKSDLELWEGGTTWVDAEYDERLGEALRPKRLLEESGLPDLLADGTWYTMGHRSPLDPNKQSETIPAHLFPGALNINPDDNTVSGGGLEYTGVLYYKGKGKPAVSIGAAEDWCFKWLVEEFKAPRAKTKVDYQDEVSLSGRFHGLTDTAFRRAWKNAKKENIHASWHRPGPIGSS